MIPQNYKIWSIVFTGKQFTFNKNTANEGNNKQYAPKEDEGFMYNLNKPIIYKDLLFFLHPDLHTIPFVNNY